MKYLLIILLALPLHAYQTGDIIFIKSQTTQSQALREATGSEWTHVGIIYGNNVIEEVGGVKTTSFKNFIGRSNDGAYRIYRFNLFTADKTQRLSDLFQKYNKPYDIYFEWDNNRQYCSEFVYKVFLDLTGKGVGTLQKFKDMNLESKAVKALIKARYLNNGKTFDVNETIITPISQMKDPNMILIESSDINRRTF